MAQVAAEVLSVEPNQIIVCSSDTDITPFDSGAYASSTTFISGTAVQKGVRRGQTADSQGRSDVFEVGAEELKCLDGGVYDRSGGLLSYADICHRALTRRISFRLWRRHHIFSTSSPPPFAATFRRGRCRYRDGRSHGEEDRLGGGLRLRHHPRMAEGQIEGACGTGHRFA